jgi:hypothetical protein
MAQAGNELSDKCPNSIDRKTALGIVCINVYLGFISLVVSQVEGIYGLGGTAHWFFSCFSYATECPRYNVHSDSDLEGRGSVD